MEENQKTDAIPEPQNKKFKIDKKMLISFAAGIVLCAVVFTAVIFGVNPELLKGTVSYEDVSLRSKEAAAAKIAAADRPLILLTESSDDLFNYEASALLHAAARFKDNYGKYADIYVLRVKHEYDVPFNAGFEKMIIIEGGKLVSYTSISYWITVADIVNYMMTSGASWVEHVELASSPSNPTVYSMFYANPDLIRFRIGASDLSDDNLGEIRLFAGKNIPENYHLCNGANEAGFNQLAAYYPNDPFSFESYTYPDLTDNVPAANLHYTVCNYGRILSEQFDVSISSSNEIAYYEMKDKPIDRIYASEIKLLKNLPDRYNRTFFPCDGRIMNISQYPILYDLIGDTYRQSRDIPIEGYFCLPYLTGLSPIADAEYYIAVEGIYPYVKI